YDFVGNDGPVCYFASDYGAPRKRVIAIDTRRPDGGAWREVVPQGEDVIDGVRLIHDWFVVNYLRDAHSRLRLFDMEGRLVRELALPTLGTVSAVTGEGRDAEMFFAFTSFLYTTTIFRHDFATGVTSDIKAPAIDS